MIINYYFKIKPKILGYITKVVYYKNKNIKFGKNFTCDSIPHIFIESNSKLQISQKVCFKRNIEIRIHKNSKIEIGEGVLIDRGARLLSTNQSKIIIKKNSKIGPYCILNGGDNITIGDSCLISGFVYLQTSTHQHKRGNYIKNQGYNHGEIHLNNDVWIGAHATILPNCQLGEGSIIGSNTVVTKSVDPHGIYSGVPAKKIAERT